MSELIRAGQVEECGSGTCSVTGRRVRLVQAVL